MTRHVGDGLETRIWIDVWYGNTTFMNRFHGLFWLENEKNYLIKDRWNGLHSEWNWRREVRGYENFPFVEMLAIIHIMDF